jgi:hypothetical protein
MTDTVDLDPVGRPNIDQLVSTLDPPHLGVLAGNRAGTDHNIVFMIATDADDLSFEITSKVKFQNVQQ